MKITGHLKEVARELAIDPSTIGKICWLCDRPLKPQQYGRKRKICDDPECTRLYFKLYARARRKTVRALEKELAALRSENTQLKEEIQTLRRRLEPKPAYF